MYTCMPRESRLHLVAGAESQAAQACYKEELRRQLARQQASSLEQHLMCDRLAYPMVQQHQLRLWPLWSQQAQQEGRRARLGACAHHDVACRGAGCQGAELHRTPLFKKARHARSIMRLGWAAVQGASACGAQVASEPPTWVRVAVREAVLICTNGESIRMRACWAAVKRSCTLAIPSLPSPIVLQSTNPNQCMQVGAAASRLTHRSSAQRRPAAAGLLPGAQSPAAPGTPRPCGRRLELSRVWKTMCMRKTRPAAGGQQSP